MIIIYFDIDPLTLHVTSEKRETDNVTVSVEWPQQDGAIYYISSISLLDLVPIMLTRSASRTCQLTLSYNTEYNFSVEAVSPCRPNATAFISLHYGEVYIHIL